jgi:hypothetical protein
MNGRKRPPLLALFPIACSLLALPISARAERTPLYDVDGYYLLSAAQGGDRDFGGQLAAYQRTRNEEEKRGRLDADRQDSRERNDDANRYYWWWPFRR